MNRAALARFAGPLALERRHGDDQARRALHHEWWGFDAWAGRGHGVSALERQRVFCAEVELFVPSYEIVKVWALNQTWPGHPEVSGRAPSEWPAGWRPRFVRALAEGRWPVLYALGEDLIDRRRVRDGGPRPAARVAAWVARERRAA